MAKRWKKSVDEGKEGKSLRRSETSRLWKKRTEEVKKEEAGLCVWEETSKMRKLGMTRRKKRRPVCVERNEEEVVVVVVVVVVRAAQWTRCLPVSRAGPVGPHTHTVQDQPVLLFILEPAILGCLLLLLCQSCNIFLSEEKEEKNMRRN